MPAKAFSDMGDRMTEALVTGNFDCYAQVMQLPLTIVPMGEPAYVLETEEALRRDFDLYHAVLKLHGVTDIFREVREVREEGEGWFCILCRVHIMVHANRIAEPFASEMLIRQQAEAWKITEIRSTAGHIGWTLGQADIGPGRDFLKR